VNNLERELQHRREAGNSPSTVAGINAALLAIGYRLDRSMDCLSMNRHVTGDYAGASYPAINVYPVEADTGMSACHVDARRDANFCELQRIRYEEELFAVVRGRILEI